MAEQDATVHNVDEPAALSIGERRRHTARGRGCLDADRVERGVDRRDEQQRRDARRELAKPPRRPLRPCARASQGRRTPALPGSRHLDHGDGVAAGHVEDAVVSGVFSCRPTRVWASCVVLVGSRPCSSSVSRPASSRGAWRPRVLRSGRRRRRHRSAYREQHRIERLAVERVRSSMSSRIGSDSAATASRLSVAAPSRKRSPRTGGPIPSAPRNASACSSGKRSDDRAAAVAARATRQTGRPPRMARHARRACASADPARGPGRAARSCRSRVRRAPAARQIDPRAPGRAAGRCVPPHPNVRTTRSGDPTPSLGQDRAHGVGTRCRGLIDAAAVRAS